MKIQRPSNEAEKAAKSTLEVIVFTRKEAESWQCPSFQREPKANNNVRDLATRIGADGGVIPGVITFGVVSGKQFLIDGQQRRHAFINSGRQEGYADARFIFCESMSQLAQEYVSLNQHLVNFSSDDVLKGAEVYVDSLRRLHESCDFIGYNRVRHRSNGAVLRMSVALRCWFNSSRETPGGSGVSALNIAQGMSEADTKEMIDFMLLMRDSWGLDEQYWKLWGALNLTICCWMYRRTVLSRYSPKSVVFDRHRFGNLSMSLSASEGYLEWLVGRQFTPRDSGPCYCRIRDLFAKRLVAEGEKRPSFPHPQWVSN